jgi:hypothetical protein
MAVCLFLFLFLFWDILGRGLLSPVHGIFGWSLLFWFWETMYTCRILCLLPYLLFPASTRLFPLVRLSVLALEVLLPEIPWILPTAWAWLALCLFGALAC